MEIERETRVLLELRTDDRGFWAALLDDDGVEMPSLRVLGGPTDPGLLSDIFTVNLQIDLVNFSASVAAGVVANWVTSRWRASGRPSVPLSMSAGMGPGTTVILGEDELARISQAVAQALAERTGTDGPDPL
jgi:hypothetical protein